MRSLKISREYVESQFSYIAFEKLKYPDCITDYLFWIEWIDHTFKQIIGL